jgi:WD40 repeat protein
VVVRGLGWSVAGLLALSGCGRRAAGDGIDGGGGATAIDGGFPGEAAPDGRGATAPPSPEQPPAMAHCAGPPLELTGALRLAPVDPAQAYVRCGSHGPEGSWQVTLSPKGHFLAARTAAGTVRLIDVDGWREVTQLASPVGRLDAVAFSPDGAHLATVSAEMGEVSLWRTVDGGLERSWALAPASTIDAWASALAFSSDGRRLATSLGSNSDPHDLPVSFQIIDITESPTIATAKVNPQSMDFGVAVAAIAFVANDTKLFVDTRYQVGNSNGTQRLSLIDVESNRETVLFNAYNDYLDGYAASPDGQTVAFEATAGVIGAGFQPGLTVVSTASGQAVTTDPTFRGRVLAFSPDGGGLYVQQADVVTTLDALTLRPTGSFSWGTEPAFRGIAPNGNLVAATADATSWWEAATGAVTRTLSFAADAITWSRDGSLEVASARGSLFHAFRAADGMELCAPPSATNAVTTLGMSPLGRAVAYGYDDGTVEVARVDGSAPSRRFASATGLVRALAPSDDGLRVAVRGTPPTGSGTPPLTIFDSGTGAALIPVASAAYDYSSGVMSPDGRSFAYATYDPTLLMWGVRAIDVATGRVLLDLPPPGMSKYATADRFNFDSTELAVATEHGVEAWRLSDATRVTTYSSGSRSLSPYWTFVVATAPDYHMDLRHAFNGSELREFPVEDFFSGATFSGDEQLVAAPSMVTHTHAVDFFATHVWDVWAGTELRVLPAQPSVGYGGSAVLPADGTQMLTLAGGSVAVWCR